MAQSISLAGSGLPKNAMKGLVPEPLLDLYSNTLFPDTLQSAFKWARYLRQRHGDLVMATQRGLSYFLDTIDIVGDIDDAESRQNYTERLINKHQVLQLLFQVGMDLQFTGNSFTSVVTPVTRVLICPDCGNVRYLSNMQRGKDYDYNKLVFTSKCPACKYSGEFKFKDYLNHNADDHPFRTIFWNPENIDIDYCALLNTEKITYTPSADDKDRLHDENSSVALEQLPEVLLRVIENEGSIVFNANSCIHLKLPGNCLTQEQFGGWGIPKFLSAFKYVVQLMLLERQMESAVKDFILPLRLLYPDPGRTHAGGSDPGKLQHNIRLQELKALVEDALESQSLKQSSWHMLPVPVAATQMGGDAKALVPVELLQYTLDRLLDVTGIPAELSKNSIGLMNSVSPMALRAFEKSWMLDIKQLNIWLNWYLKRCNELLGWPELEGSLLMQSTVYDPAQQAIMAQLYQAGKVSTTTFYRNIKLDPALERRRTMDDRIQEAKSEMDLNKKLEEMGVVNELSMMNSRDAFQQAMSGGAPDAQQGAGAPAGLSGAPPPQAGAMPQQMGGVIQPASTGDLMQDIQSLQSMTRGINVSLDQLNADAQFVANILMRTPVGAPRNQIFAMIKSSNESLWAAVKGILEQLESQARQQGVEAVRSGQM